MNAKRDRKRGPRQRPEPATDRGRISIAHIAAAVRRFQSMAREELILRVDDLHVRQPNLLGSVAVQARFGAAEPTIAFMLEVFIVCDLAVETSGSTWRTVTEAEQARHLERLAANARRGAASPAAERRTQRRYVIEHPEPALLAWVSSRCTEWLLDLERHGTARENDKYVLMALTNIVDCVAHAPPA